MHLTDSGRLRFVRQQTTDPLSLGSETPRFIVYTRRMSAWRTMHPTSISVASGFAVVIMDLCGDRARVTVATCHKVTACDLVAFVATRNLRCESASQDPRRLSVKFDW